MAESSVPERPENRHVAAVEALLGDPATHGGLPVERRETHAALVFLAGDDAYKIKRPVRYDYLDFSTPEKRAAMLRREMELNAPAAPELYLGLVAVTRAPDGTLALHGTGQPVEWALHMRRFPAGAELSKIAAAGGLDRAMAERLGAGIAAYHAAAPRRDTDGAELIGEIVTELDAAFAGMTDVLPADRVAVYRARIGAAWRAVQPLLTARTRAGHVRRGHGDLHLGNIVALDGRPVPFDALEFDERLGTMDVLYDLAFLLMDLRHAGLPEAANTVMNRYFFHAGDPAQLDGLAALPLFLALRAAIRAMTTVQAARLDGTGDAAGQVARGYLDDAVAFLSPPPARLIAIGGLSGTGKTTLARDLAPGIGPVPGALHLRSDLLRKAHMGVDALTRLPDSAYAPGINAAVYDMMFDRAERALGAGHAVVLDGVFLHAAERDAARDLARAAGVAFDGIWLEAAAGTMLDRVTARIGDASDADARVVRLQLDAAPAVTDWRRLDADGPREATLAAARAALSG